MPAGKKKNPGNFGPREKKVYRLMVWLLIGPAVFFALYWIYSGGGGNTSGRKAPPPREFRQAGERVTVDGNNLLAAPDGRVSYSAELALGGNRVIAEGGYTFLVIPLVIPDTFSDPPPTQWYLVDGEGLKYDLLKVMAKSPVEGFAVPPAGPGSRLVYLVFKISKDSGDTFLVYHPGREQFLAWKMPRPGGPMGPGFLQPGPA